MNRTLIAVVLIVFLCHFCCYAENNSNENPVLHVYSGENIVGQTLPPGTYRVVPKLGTNQAEVFTSLNLLEADSFKPIAQPQAEPISASKPDAEPITAAVPQKTSQTKPQPDKEQDVSSGTGPECDCEYGLPGHDGANCEIQLSSADLLAGFHLDDSVNMNKACEVHQWIIFGKDKNNRIEINISAWNQRAEGYYNWKHGMLSTGQYQQSDLPIGNKQLFVEGKNDCNKQLVMQVGMYLVEMDRPPVEGITQQTDPIKREDFIAVAKAVENRISAVAGIPPRDVMNGNPSTIRWRSVSWNVRLQNDSLLQVQGAGTGTWGSEWRAVGSGAPAIISWNGIGTGQGPVIVYQRSTNVWTLVLVNYATGALQNIHNFNQRVTLMSGGEYGATLRSGNKCYDYSWDHLKEIDCKSKDFFFGGTQSSTSGTVDNNTLDNVTSVGVTGTTTSGSSQGNEEPEPKKEKPDNKKPIVVPSGLSTNDYYRDSEFNFYIDGIESNPPWVFEFDDIVKIEVLETVWVEDPDDPYATIEYPKKFWATPVFKTNGFGEFVNGKYHASVAGENYIYLLPDTMVNAVDRGGTVTKSKGPWGPSDHGLKVHVNPEMTPAASWPLDKDAPVVCINLFDAKGGTLYLSTNEPIRVSLQGPNTPLVEKVADYDNCATFYVRDFIKNGNLCPPAVYTIYVYQRGKPEGGVVGLGDMENDLHTVREYKIALPVKQGSFWEKDILVTTTWKKFKVE